MTAFTFTQPGADDIHHRDYTNLVENPGFEYEDTENPSWILQTGHTIGTSNVRTGLKALAVAFAGSDTLIYNSKAFDCSEDDIFYIEVYAKCSTTNVNAGAANVAIEYMDTTGATLGTNGYSSTNPTTSYQLIGGQIEMVPGAALARVVLFTSGATTGTWYFDDVRCIRVVEGRHLAPNSDLEVNSVTAQTSITLAEQASTPATPTNALTLFADSSNRFSWIGENGFKRTFDGTANTANRTYTLPDASGTVALLASPAFTGTPTLTGTRPTIEVIWTGESIKHRLASYIAKSAHMTLNASFNGSVWAQDDTSRASMVFNLNSSTAGSEAFNVLSIPAGSTTITTHFSVSALGNVIAGAPSVLSTSATDGFLFIGYCSGTPTGTPTTVTGKIPVVFDRTNAKVYYYNTSAGAWQGSPVGITATAAELNTLSGITATTAELNRTAGLTSGAQAQLDAKVGFLVTGWSTGPGTGTTLYYSPGGSYNAGSGTETQRQTILSACTLIGLRIHLGGAQPGTGTLVFTVKVNGSASAITKTVTAGASANTDHDDLAHTVSISTGDKVSIEAVNNASGTGAAHVTVTLVYR